MTGPVGALLEADLEELRVRIAFLEEDMLGLRFVYNDARWAFREAKATLERLDRELVPLAPQIASRVASEASEGPTSP